MTPRKGDRIRVTYEATYVDETLGGRCHYVQTDGCATSHLTPADATIEVLEDLRPGDVYRDSRKDGIAPEGHTVAYDGRDPDKPWWCATCAFRCMDATVTRPLTLLVRDGQPVTP